MTIDLNTALLVFAMKEESQGHFKDYDVLYTGIGKVNASYALTKTLSKKKPSVVINLGTAGSQTFPAGSVVCCTSFIQRDMDVQALGFEPFQTPFSDVPVILEYGNSIEKLPSGICGSGDNFETTHSITAYNLVDMEAYALAHICKQEDIPFLCLKYISDGADEDASEDWTEALNNAAKALKNTLLNISTSSS